MLTPSKEKAEGQNDVKEKDISFRGREERGKNCTLKVRFLKLGKSMIIFDVLIQLVECSR